ncbi:uncharacterized protein LOC128386937 isoform X2 [Panonychus citri]|uniref:uncharacterized protein LOC128386937 isoform X2 n=1 Tax=Panonychus citri TaxID=50023 RepID=UPI002307AFF3|nr:uncharacterized protein LOC128386937 isoform X2 [Panonychus citri]XP_053202044.1 uncharacterized protein LOC128386937 isoform X2 [Panonychus citri]
MEKPIMSKDIKITAIGHSGAGKTCFMTQERFHTFPSETITDIGVDFVRLKYSKDGKQYNVQLWDTAGQERFRSIPKTLYQSAHGILYFYDITKRKSLEALEKVWHEEVMIYSNRKELIKVVVGNKSDLEDKRQVSREEGQRMATKLSASFFETSAKNGKNVSRAIYDCFERVVVTAEHQEEIAPERSSEIINLTETEPKDWSCCPC